MVAIHLFGFLFREFSATTLKITADYSLEFIIVNSPFDKFLHCRKKSDVHLGLGLKGIKAILQTLEFRSEWTALYLPESKSTVDVGELGRGESENPEK